MVLLLNAIGCSLAAGAYAIWAFKWTQRRRVWLALVNLASASVAIGFAIGYALIFLDSPLQPVPSQMFRPFVGFVFLAPAVARLLELRDSEYREAFARSLGSRLSSDS